MGEAHIPAERPQASEESRFSPPHVHTGRAGDPQGAAPEGSEAPVRLIWRIRDRSTFVALRRSGRRGRSGAVAVTFVPGSDADPPRVAYAIGRGVGGAVVRNRLRRRLRAVMTELGPRLGPGAYLVGAAPEAVDVPFGALTEMVSGAVEAATDKARR